MSHYFFETTHGAVAASPKESNAQSVLASHNCRHTLLYGTVLVHARPGQVVASSVPVEAFCRLARTHLCPLIFCRFFFFFASCCIGWLGSTARFCLEDRVSRLPIAKASIHLSREPERRAARLVRSRSGLNPTPRRGTAAVALAADE